MLRHLVPEREGEHPAQLLQTILSPFSVGREDHLGIAGCGEYVPEALQTPAQSAKVVDLSVERDPITCGGIAHGLVSSIRRIDNRQTSMNQHERSFVYSAECDDLATSVVRPPVGQYGARGVATSLAAVRAVRAHHLTPYIVPLLLQPQSSRHQVLVEGQRLVDHPFLIEFAFHPLTCICS